MFCPGCNAVYDSAVAVDQRVSDGAVELTVLFTHRLRHSHESPLNERLLVFRVGGGMVEVKGWNLRQVAIGDLIEATALDDGDRNTWLSRQPVCDRQSSSAAADDLETH